MWENWCNDFIIKGWWWGFASLNKASVGRTCYLMKDLLLGHLWHSYFTAGKSYLCRLPICYNSELRFCTHCVLPLLWALCSLPISFVILPCIHFCKKLKLPLRVSIVDSYNICLEIFGVILAALGVFINGSKNFVTHYFLCIYEHFLRAGLKFIFILMWLQRGNSQ